MRISISCARGRRLDITPKVPAPVNAGGPIQRLASCLQKPAHCRARLRPPVPHWVCRSVQNLDQDHGRCPEQGRETRRRCAKPRPSLSQPKTTCTGPAGGRVALEWSHSIRNCGQRGRSSCRREETFDKVVCNQVTAAEVGAVLPIHARVRSLPFGQKGLEQCSSDWSVRPSCSHCFARDIHQ
jgi:hypothetical protein